MECDVIESEAWFIPRQATGAQQKSKVIQSGMDLHTFSQLSDP